MKKWLKELTSSNGNVSSKRVAYLGVIVSSIAWLTSQLVSTGITTEWVTAFQTLLASVSVGYVGGVFAEKKEKEEVIKKEEE